MNQNQELIAKLIGIILGSSAIVIIVKEKLKELQRKKKLYGKLRFQFARLISVVKNKDAIIEQINKNGILDYASMKNQKEAIENIYEILKSDIQYLEKKHRPFAQNYINAFHDQSPERAKKLLNTIEEFSKKSLKFNS